MKSSTTRQTFFFKMLTLLLSFIVFSTSAVNVPTVFGNFSAPLSSFSNFYS